MTSLASQPPAEEEAPPPPKKRPASTFKPFSRPVESDDDEDYDPYENSERLDIRITDLDVEIGNVSRGKETIGGLMAVGPGGDEARGATNIKPEDSIEAFKKEGSALRPVSKERKNSTDA